MIELIFTTGNGIPTTFMNIPDPRAGFLLVFTLIMISYHLIIFITGLASNEIRFL